MRQFVLAAVLVLPLSGIAPHSNMQSPVPPSQPQSEAAKRGLARFQGDIRKLNEDYLKNFEESKQQYVKALDDARKDALAKEDLDEATRLLEEKTRIQKEKQSVPGTAKGFEILHVKVGVTDKWVDATDDFRKLVKDGKLRFRPKTDKINWSFADPAFGVHKIIVIVYSIHGVVYLSVTRDDEDVSLA